MNGPAAGLAGLPGAAVLPEALTDLSLRQLLSFRAVADEGSFHGAADALDYTQSAVSQHVMGLESALGVRLFDRGRGRRTVELTEAGRLLQRHVEAITDRLQAARADLLAYAAGRDRDFARRRVPERRNPRAAGDHRPLRRGVAQRRDPPHRGQQRPGLYELLGPGALDLSFGVLPLEEGPFEAVELLEDPFVLVASVASPLAAVRGLPSMQLIGEQRLIGFRSCRSTRWVEDQIRSRGAEPNFVFRSEDNGTVQAMVGAGLGTALVPLLAVDPGDPSTVVIPTDLPHRRIALIWHRDRYRSPAALAFVEIAL